MPDNHFRIGIDLGGTKIETAVLDSSDQIIIRQRAATQADLGYQKIVQNIQKLFQFTLKKLPNSSTFSVGMGIPGIINPTTQKIINSNTAVLIGQKLGQDLQKILNCQIIVENDANCFTLAEAVAGAGQDYEFIFGIIMGTGCGGGISINQKIRRGLHGIAGEWGHASIDPDGALCYCGKRGCIESMISGGGVQKLHLDRTKEKLTMEKIIQGWHNKDTQCNLTMNNFFHDFGRAVSVLINILDPDAIVLGGGLSKIPELYSIGVDYIKKNTFHEDPKTPIIENKLGDSAGVIGAAWIGANQQSIH